MDAGSRIRQAFQGDPAELEKFLRTANLKAKIALAMMFQNPAVPSAQQAAEEAITLLLQEARGHAQDAGLNESQRAQWLMASELAVEDFRGALSAAVSTGIPVSDRAALAIRLAQLLELPME